MCEGDTRNPSDTKSEIQHDENADAKKDSRPLTAIRMREP